MSTLTSGPDTLTSGGDTLTFEESIPVVTARPSARGWIGSPFAVYPFAAAAPASMTPPPQVPTLTALYIDPRSRDHVVQGDGETARMPTVRQQVLIALMTIFGSMSTQQKFGIVLPKKIDENFQRRMRFAVEQACRHLTISKRAKITSVDTDTTNAMGRAITTISFIDLTTGLHDSVSN